MTPTSNPRPRRLFHLLEKIAGYSLAAFFLSFAVPALIVLAPDFVRIYLHVWKVALRLEPDCPDWRLHAFTCAAPGEHPRTDQEPIKRQGKPPL